MIALMHDHRAYSTLAAMCNHCISAFGDVSDSIGDRLPVLKSNKLYREYSDALRIASMIMRRQDIAISQRDSRPDELVPVFRIDMALLFEHYALAVMRRTFSRRAVQYQVAGYGGRFVADFLLDTGRHRAIVDTKYIDGISATVAKADYIKQLSAYARDKRLLRALGYDTTDDTTLPIVPCILIYQSYRPRRRHPLQPSRPRNRQFLHLPPLHPPQTIEIYNRPLIDINILRHTLNVYRFRYDNISYNYLSQN